jgi:hypothetical protein
MAPCNAFLAHTIRQLFYATIAAEAGLTVEELLAEAEDFLAQPLADQLREVEAIHAAMQAQGEPWPEYEATRQALMEADGP